MHLSESERAEFIRTKSYDPKFEDLIRDKMNIASHDYTSIEVQSPIIHDLGVQIFSVKYLPDSESSILASVWDHHHNFLVKIDLQRNSQQILYKNGDYEKIIVDIVQMADKVIICDRDHKVKVFIGSIKVHELRHECFFQRSIWLKVGLDYYAMSKVFASHGDKFYFVSNDNRGKVVQVDMSYEGYPETVIVFPQLDIFQIAFNGQQLLAAIGENSGILSFFDLNRRQIVGSLELSKGSTRLIS